MLILSNEDIEKLLPVGACLEVLEEAYRDLGNGMAATVPRYDVFSPTNPNEFYEYKTMSGVLPNRKIAALRLNSSTLFWRSAPTRCSRFLKPCELDATTYKRADPLIIHWREAKPFQIAIGVDRQSIPDVAEGWQHPITREDSAIWDFPTISQLVNGEHPGRTKNDAISCFCNNVGLGLQFAAVGSEVLARAREARVGREIPTEWFLESVHP